MVYFIRNATNGCIKVGTAKRPRARLRQLQTATPDRLELLGAIAGGRAEEKQLHAVFAPCRVRGEWFSPAPELMAFVWHMLRRAEVRVAPAPAVGCWWPG